MSVADKEPCAALSLSSTSQGEQLLTAENQCRLRYPEINKFIVQDLPETKEAAESYIQSKGLSDRIQFEAQDFFKPQQRKGKYVFVMQRGV
jgi:hypothetical protein